MELRYVHCGTMPFLPSVMLCIGLQNGQCAAFLFRLYLSLVRPILEYACLVWDPYTVKNIEQLESVQKFAFKHSAHRWDTGYCTLLDMFNIASLETHGGNILQNCQWHLIFSL